MVSSFVHCIHYIRIARIPFSRLYLAANDIVEFWVMCFPGCVLSRLMSEAANQIFKKAKERVYQVQALPAAGASNKAPPKDGTLDHSL